ncbi:hypothetical protein [Asanoa sp. NPDC050611]|uniref:hypothetical protein n=1 Tax=Asanoa sp. NPDC050611 TaxID=3157098 RepID=UPI0033E87FF8
MIAVRTAPSVLSARAEGTIRAPKGAVGRTDPTTEQTAGLPGTRRLESSAIRLTVLSDAVAFEVLGTAWRNPAGRQLYDVGSWGYLPWILSFVVLTCAALARDFIVDRLKAALSRAFKRDTTRPGDRQRAPDVRRRRPAGGTPRVSGRKRAEAAGSRQADRRLSTGEIDDPKT